MPMQLSKPVAAYFEAKRSFDVDGMLAAFAVDAIVGDEGKTRSGTQAIRAWIMEATVGNQAIATPLSVERDGDAEIVAARVAGAFPGSPITLAFRFTVSDGRITRLSIA